MEESLTVPVAGIPRKTATSSLNLPAGRAAGTDIRIYKDGLLLAKCHAVGIAPSRLLVSIDPLHYPVNSSLDIEFVDKTTGSPRLPATIVSRSAQGIELMLSIDLT
jgi:hypothetical protein